MDTKTIAMLMSYSKDIVCHLIDAGKITSLNSVTETWDKLSKSALKNYINYENKISSVTKRR